jgi:UDP-N-acetylmuramyl pentapeptide synthase
MKTAIATSPIFYTVYRKQSPPRPYFKVIGAYSDIRDAIQAIATAYRKNGGGYAIESSENRPKHWVHPSRYRD